MKKTLLLLFMATFFSTAFSQISFYRLFGGEEFDYAHDVVELPDSGYLVAGTSGSFNVGHADAFLIRTDKYANRLWSIPYGGAENDGANDLERLENYGTYMLGRTTGPAGDFDAWLSLVDDQGTILWERTYPGPNWEEVVESALTQDTGLVLGVKQFGTSTADYDYSLIRINSSGDTIWAQEYSAPGNDEVTNILAYQDSMFLVSSNHWDEVLMQNYGFVELIHEDGSLVWSDTVGIFPGSSYLNDFFVSNDTLFGVGAFKLDDTSTFNRMRHVRYLPLAENGVILTQMSISAGNMISDVVTPIPNGQYKYSSFRFQDPTSGSPYSDFYIGLNSYIMTPIAATANPNTYGEDRLYNAIPTLDGGTIFVGYQSLPTGGIAMAMLKIGPGYDYPTIPETPYILPLVKAEELGELISVNVYPNPANEIVTVDVSNEISDHYSLINLEGQKLISGKISAGNTLISIGHLTAGMYLLQFYKDNELKGTKSIIVQ